MTCLSTSTSNDKLAFDVGLQHDSQGIASNKKKCYMRIRNKYIFIHQGESCWWTIHPASKQRSEGEKVRIGDDIILVSVASERYLVNDTTNFSQFASQFIIFVIKLSIITYHVINKI